MKRAFFFLICFLICQNVFADDESLETFKFPKDISCLSEEDISFVIGHAGIKEADFSYMSCSDLKKLIEAFKIRTGYKQPAIINLSISREELRNRMKNAEKGIY